MKNPRRSWESCPKMYYPDHFTRSESTNWSSPCCLNRVAKSLQSCLTLCDPIDSSPPGSPVPGILQGRTLEWVAISFSNAWKWKVKSEREVAQSCPTLSDPMDCSLPGSSIHGIFQARVLEWGAIALCEKRDGPSHFSKPALHTATPPPNKSEPVRWTKEELQLSFTV